MANMKRTKPPVGKKEKASRVQPGTFLDSALYQRARAQALIEGRNVGELIDSAIEEYLAKRGFKGEK